METAESGQPSAGPRYAPDDPTLPKPWKGLIDGNTGLSYYWNPETNVTQYEKPASSGPPQAASLPKLAQLPTPHPTQPKGFAPQPVKQNTQTTQQQGQHVIMAQGHHQVISNLDMAQDQGIQFGQFTQPPGQSRPQMIQHSGLQTSQMGQLIPQNGIQHLSQHSGQPMQQPVQQLPMHGGLQMLQQHNSQVPQPQGQQYSYHQMQYMEHQQSMHNPGLHSSQQHTQLAMQGQHIPPHQLEYQLAFEKGDKVDLTQNNQPAYPQSQFQPANSSYSQTLLAGRNSVLTHPADAFFGQAQQFSDSVSRQQPASMGQLQQTGCGFSNHQLGPSFQNHVSPSMTPNQQPDLPPVGGKMRYEHSLHVGDSNGYFANAKVEGPMMSPSQAKLAATPVARNQQESRMGAITNQNFAPGYAGAFNSTGYSMHKMHGNAVGSPSFPSNALVRASFVPLSENAVLSPAELYRQEHEVTATGDNVPAPFITFEATGFPPEILRDMRSAGFLSPTPIQAQTWPIALESRDIVAIAKTGSGKTLGYLIPAFILLRKRQNNAHNGPTVLVLAPTRELATQIQEEVKKFGRSSRVSCMCLYGGVPKGPQLEGLERGADIVVATPGRLNDILEMKKIHFGQVSLLVLDEADRMLDMGFEPQIRKIVNEIPMQRQTLMYTATWPKEVRKIASDLLINPIQVNIGSIDELAANKSITQYVEVVPQMEKERRLEQILREQERGSKVIIFCSTKRLCDQLARSIGRNFGAVAIHGDKSQGERDWVLNQFRNGKSPILVATDVAARGLDIKDIRVVINYDFPTGIEDYVHRIGRTGRAGATGVSYTFFSEQDWKYAADLVKVLEGANQYVTPEVRQIALRGGPSCRDRGGMSRFGSGKGNSDELWNFGGRGYGGMRSGGFNGGGGMTDGGFSRRGGVRDAPFGGRVGRNGSFSGRGNRGRGFGGHASRGRNDRRLLDHYNHVDGRGRGWGRGRVDGRKHVERSRGRSNSSSPERVRTWGYSRSRSRSWSRSSCRSQSWSRGSSRSYSRSRSPRSRSRSRSRSRRPGKVERRTESNFDKMEVPAPEFGDPESGTSPMSPVMHVDALPGSEHALDAMPANHESKEGSGFKPVA